MILVNDTRPSPKVASKVSNYKLSYPTAGTVAADGRDDVDGDDNSDDSRTLDTCHIRGVGWIKARKWFYELL